MDPLTKIVRLLPQLDSQQRSELLTRLKALDQFGHAVLSSGAPQTDEAFVLDAIHETLHKHGSDRTALAVMRKSVTEKLQDGYSFRDKVPGLMEFLHESHPTVVGQHALLLLGLELLLLDLRRRGEEGTFKLLMARIHRVGPILDAHFPGYAQAGLLRILVERPRLSQA